MSFIASRSTLLVAPLRDDLALAEIDEPVPVTPTAAARDTAAPATRTSVTREAVEGASRADDATRAVESPAMDSAPQAVATTAAATTAKPAFAGQTATVAQIGKPAAMPQAPAPAGSIGSAIFALAMVIGLILALSWLARRMPGFRGASANSALRVVGSLSLSPRERLVVVAVGDTQLVLGVGAGGTRTLHTLSEPLPVAEAAGTPAFAQLLSQHFGKKA